MSNTFYEGPPNPSPEASVIMARINAFGAEIAKYDDCDPNAADTLADLRRQQDALVAKMADLGYVFDRLKDNWEAKK